MHKKLYHSLIVKQLKRQILDEDVKGRRKREKGEGVEKETEW